MQIPPRTKAADGRLYTASNSSYWSVMEIPVLTEAMKDSWDDLFPSKKRSEEMINNLCNNRAQGNSLKQCIFDTLSTRKIAARYMLFELLSNATLLSQNGGVGGNNNGQRAKNWTFGGERHIRIWSDCRWTAMTPQRVNLCVH